MNSIVYSIEMVKYMERIGMRYDMRTAFGLAAHLRRKGIEPSVTMHEHYRKDRFFSVGHA